MGIYKLYCQFNENRSPMYSLLNNVSYFRGNIPYYFGLKIDINKLAYEKFEKKISTLIIQNNVEQCIMTQYKMKKLITCASQLNIKVKDIKFNFENEENYPEFKTKLLTGSINDTDMEQYMDDFEMDGMIIKQISIRTLSDKELIKVYDDGCIFIENDSLASESCVSDIIDFLIKGII